MRPFNVFAMIVPRRWKVTSELPFVLLFVRSNQSWSSNRTTSLASFYDVRQGVIRTDYDPAKQLMMTVGTDRTIKVCRSFLSSHHSRDLFTDMECGIDCTKESLNLIWNRFIFILVSKRPFIYLVLSLSRIFFNISRSSIFIFPRFIFHCCYRHWL